MHQRHGADAGGSLGLFGPEGLAANCGAAAPHRQYGTSIDKSVSEVIDFSSVLAIKLVIVNNALVEPVVVVVAAMAEVVAVMAAAAEVAVATAAAVIVVLAAAVAAVEIVVPQAQAATRRKKAATVLPAEKNVVMAAAKVVPVTVEVLVAVPAAVLAAVAARALVGVTVAPISKIKQQTPLPRFGGGRVFFLSPIVYGKKGVVLHAKCRSAATGDLDRRFLSYGILSNLRHKLPDSYNKVTIKPVLIKDELKYQLTYHYQKKTLNENLTPDQTEAKLVELFQKDFKNGLIHTGELADYQILISKKDKVSILKKKPTKVEIELTHNRKEKVFAGRGHTGAIPN